MGNVARVPIVYIILVLKQMEIDEEGENTPIEIHLSIIW